jgi:hypothetical protein
VVGFFVTTGAGGAIENAVLDAKTLLVSVMLIRAAV